MTGGLPAGLSSLSLIRRGYVSPGAAAEIYGYDAAASSGATPAR